MRLLAWVIMLLLFIEYGRLSLATIFLLSSSVTIFLIGLVSEQITQLMYRPSDRGGGSKDDR